MTVARETIYEALLTQLKTAGSTFKTYSRRWLSTMDDPNERLALLPLLVPWEGTEDVQWTNRGIGSVMTFTITVEIYAKIPDGMMTPGVKDAATSGSEVLNPLLDAVEAALAPTGHDGRQTLGGLVTDCRVEGTITKVLGDADPSGLCGALVPVKILVTR